MQTRSMDQLANSNRDKLIDLLNERLTFERSSVKLYDTVIQRMEDSDEPGIEQMLDRMHEHRNQEKEHEEWLEEQIRTLGGDAHGETEMSKLIKTESKGIEEIVLDGDPKLEHLFHALLAAELVDNNGWELLVQLAEEAGDDDARNALEEKLEEEQEHLTLLREAVGDFNARDVLGRTEPLPDSP